MSRFKVTKIGLLNFWLYDEEEYDFYGGKLILRGTNGSGKSVTMQSFIPLILDGNKSPERLDPFGSKERKIEDYIIGDSEGVQKEESTAYLYMETFNEELNKYITIGLGFRGRKGRPVESWGFCLKDGLRIGKDFYLYKDPVNKIPLTKNELKSRLGTINEFTDNTKDYKAMVNRLLFGFPNLDMYDEFIKLLLQLRSNKLSKEYKPTNLVEVLNKVLQPLTEEDLRPLSEAIEQMNKTKEQIETLEKNNKSLKDFLKIYRNYNELLLYTKAKNYKNKFDEYNDSNKKIKSLETNVNNIKEDLENKNNRLNTVLQDIEVNNNKKKELDNSDLKQKIESLANINENIKTLEKKIAELDSIMQKDEEDKIKLNKNIALIEDEIYKLQMSLKELISDLKDLANESGFNEFKNYDLEDNGIDFTGLFMALKKYEEHVKQILDLLLKEEKIYNDSESIKVDYEKLSNIYKELSNNLAIAENNLKESIMAWEEDFINKLNNNKELKIDDIYKKQIFELMNNYSQDNFMQIRILYNDYTNDLINKIIKDNLSLNNKIELKRKDLSLLEEEYKKLEKEDDLEIPVLNKESENILKNNNIFSIPLYKCIEFKDNVDEKTKNNLEAGLLDLNILNAKILPEADIAKVNKLGIQIIYLTKSVKKRDNLLKYFNVKLTKDIPIKEDYIKEILESISINASDSVAITATGQSKIDILNSQVDYNYKQSFIGYLKRLEIKEQKLKELQKNIDILNNEINIIQNTINKNNDKIEIIKAESNNLPDNNLISNNENKIIEINKSLLWNEEKQKELAEKLNIFTKELTKIKEEILNCKRGLTIPVNKESCQNSLNILSSFKDELQDFKNTKSDCSSKEEINRNYHERIEDIQNNISYRLADLNEKNNELVVNKSKRDTINELLETKEFQEQKEKLLQVEENLRSLALEKEELIKKTAELNQDVKYQEKEYLDLINNHNILKNDLSIYEEIFKREYKLGYVYEEELTDLNTMVKKIINDNSRKDKNLTDVERNFYESYNRYALELNDYSLKTINIFNDYEGEDEKYQKIYAENSRVDVISIYQGVKLNILNLAKKLENDILENKDLISTQDRHLFEDILLNTVGEKIRNRINSSNEWVSKINNIMKSMQENSALSFKLVWKSISASSDEEIDTRELVRILKMDPTMLKDEDTEKLTNHFRSKIKKAEELYADSYISFAKIIEEVLDYRSWFTFELRYQRKGDDFKELTDKTFAKFSGGERAKSMYIPLFASVYAKLNSARSDALRLIALDEAFAGVDDENIREMFGILSFLDIDFIINSQVLWGDYDTISDISICNLIRPNNSSVVSVERYRWNGKYKEIINNRKEYNEEIENA